MKAIRTFSICHNDDDHKAKHRRVKIDLRKTLSGLYGWFNNDLDVGIGEYKTVHEAEFAAKKAYNHPVWAMRSSW